MPLLVLGLGADDWRVVDVGVAEGTAAGLEVGGAVIIEAAVWTASSSSVGGAAGGMEEAGWRVYEQQDRRK